MSYNGQKDKVATKGLEQSANKNKVQINEITGNINQKHTDGKRPEKILEKTLAKSLEKTL